MYEGLRLTELHEEWANARERAARYENLDRKMSQAGAEVEAEMYDAEVRARVAAQEIGPPFIDPRQPLGVSYHRPLPLAFGVPDAERVYPAKRRVSIPPSAEDFGGAEVHWTSHARHGVPVGSCHLCHPQPTRWTPGGFVHEEHIPCE